MLFRSLKYQFTYIHLNPIGVIDNGWKFKKIKDLNTAKNFINEYNYSSFLDYSGYKRDEKNILNINEFPEYFKDAKDFKDMIDEWLDFSSC